MMINLLKMTLKFKIIKPWMTALPQLNLKEQKLNQEIPQTLVLKQA